MNRAINISCDAIITPDLQRIWNMYQTSALLILIPTSHSIAEPNTILDEISL